MIWYTEIVHFALDAGWVCNRCTPRFCDPSDHLFISNLFDLRTPSMRNAVEEETKKWRGKRIGRRIMIMIMKIVVTPPSLPVDRQITHWLQQEIPAAPPRTWHPLVRATAYWIQPKLPMGPGESSSHMLLVPLIVFYIISEKSRWRRKNGGRGHIGPTTFEGLLGPSYSPFMKCWPIFYNKGSISGH